MPYTTREKLRLAVLAVKGVRQAHAAGDSDAVDPRITREEERIEERRRLREQADADAMRNVLEHARTETAAARAKVRTARGGDEKRAAREALRRAEQDLRRTERAARQAGHHF